MKRDIKGLLPVRVRLSGILSGFPFSDIYLAFCPLAFCPGFDLVYTAEIRGQPLVLYKRIYSFMISKNIISDTQFGFRMNHSTNHAIHHSVSFIKKLHADKRHVIGIFFDLSKAFDTIDHKTLLRKLYNYGLHGSAQDLISDYLCNRYQRVKIHDEESDNILVEFGVPQGSVLGPYYFYCTSVILKTS